MSYAGLGTVFAPPGSPAYKAFWDAKARQCVNMADEGTCLAQVARHVPVTISGLGQTPSPTPTWQIAGLGFAVGWAACLLARKAIKGKI